MTARFIIVELFCLLCAVVTGAFALISLWLVIDDRLTLWALPLSVAMLVCAWRGSQMRPMPIKAPVP